MAAAQCRPPFFLKAMQENTPEFLEFVKQCQEKFLGISLPTIEILYSQKLGEQEETIIQDEKTTKKKSKK